MMGEMATVNRQLPSPSKRSPTQITPHHNFMKSHAHNVPIHPHSRLAIVLNAAVVAAGTTEVVVVDVVAEDVTGRLPHLADLFFEENEHLHPSR